MILERFKPAAGDIVQVPESSLRQTVAALFEKVGLPPEDAAEGADVLVSTDLRGVESHGVSNMLRVYLQQYRQGILNPTPPWRIMREFPGTATIDGDRGLGMIQGPRAMRLAMEKAKQVGVGVVTIFNSGHLGAVGHHSNGGRQGGYGRYVRDGDGRKRRADFRLGAALWHQSHLDRRAGKKRSARLLRCGHLSHRRQQGASGSAGRRAAVTRLGLG
jgi:hypothetical protein